MTPVRSRVDRWVPRLHPLTMSPAYWMELGAIGREGTPLGMLGEPPETLAACVGLVTSKETRRFLRRHLAKSQESSGSVQVKAARNRTVSGPLSFRYVRYVTTSAAGERRKHVDGDARVQGCGVIADGDSVTQIRASAQHCSQASTPDGEVADQLGHCGAWTQCHCFRFGSSGCPRGSEVADRHLDSARFSSWFEGDLSCKASHR